MTVQEQFWQWFIEHEDEIFDFETNQERVFDLLADRLKRVNPELTFEFGPKRATRELFISAAGIKNAFPAVTSLVSAAPKLNRFQVKAFRQRREPGIVEFRGKRVDPKDVKFILLDNGEVPGLYMFIPGFVEADAALKQIGYLLLDETLGEYDVECLGLIEMLPPEARISGPRHPLAELPDQFDRLMIQLGRRSSARN